MQKNKLFYDNVGKIVFDAYGKTYEIKDYNRSKSVNFNGSRIAISKLEVKPFIKDFNSVVSRYILDWHLTYPCPAIGYYVYLKLTNTKISMKDYFKQFKK